LSSPSYMDENLVAMLATGDQDAFTALYQRFYRQVLHFARRYTDETEAQDITADAFVQLWRKRAEFTHIKAVSSFLFVTARNRCYDLIRHKQVKSRHERELLAMMDDHYHNDFFLVQVRLEMAKLLREEIEKLPEKMREVLLLSFRDGLKPAQIAEKLNISVKTVSNQKLSAIKILKSALHHYPLESLLLLLPFVS